jgi:large subunit ribosomal protein L29
MTKAAELRMADDEELGSKLADARQELFNLRFQAVTGQLDNKARLGQVRKEIARLMTILREREIATWEAMVSEQATEAGSAPVAPLGADAPAPAVAEEEEEEDDE